MNDQMMRLAKEAGFLDGDLELFPETIERFAELVRQALAQPKQEPVCWWSGSNYDSNKAFIYNKDKRLFLDEDYPIPLYAFNEVKHENAPLS